MCESASVNGVVFFFLCVCPWLLGLFCVVVVGSFQKYRKLELFQLSLSQLFETSAMQNQL